MEAVVVEEHAGGGVDVWERVFGLKWVLAQLDSIRKWPSVDNIPCRAQSALLARSPSSS